MGDSRMIADVQLCSNLLGGHLIGNQLQHLLLSFGYGIIHGLLFYYLDSL